MKNTKDVIIIGGGAAGLSAAVACKEKGLEDILIIEREPRLGGILNQCIHDGFGLAKFGCSMTGPEYAGRYIEQIEELGIAYLLNSMVLEITPEKEVVVSSKEGMEYFQARAIILAMGCRERTRGAISLPGERPAGIYTAGVAQNLINLKNLMPGKKVVILGSGDIGLIMARRLTLEGAQVQMVIEKLPYSSGLPRNINQCLYDFDIPLYLSHTLIDIKGERRLEGVTMVELDSRGEVKPGSREEIECDTLLLSVGLIPENELSRKAGVLIDPLTGGPLVDQWGQTSVPGIFACGNVLQVHDIVDNVSLEAEYIVRGVSNYLAAAAENKVENKTKIKVTTGKGLRYVVPQEINNLEDTVFSFRVQDPAQDKKLIFKDGGRIIKEKKFKRVNPAEMIKAELSSQELKGIDNLQVELI